MTLDNQSSPCLQAALELAAAGYKIFPVPPGTKQSYIGKSNKRFGSGENWGMTDDPELIKKYWKKWPKANIGLPTGWVNGIVVIETDTIAGHPNLTQDGEVSLQAAEKRLGKLPDTWMGRSPSGSLHRFYAHPGPDYKVTSRSAKQLGEGVDVKGDGGMVVAPPSVSKKGVYEWINATPIAELPDVWIKELTRRIEPEAHAPLPEDANPFERYGVGEDDEPPSIDEVKEALQDIENNDLHFDDWKDVLMRVWKATKGSNEGFRLIDTWSQQSNKYHRDETKKQWRLITGSPPTRYSPRAIINLAYYGFDDGENQDDDDDEVEAAAQVRSEINGAKVEQAESSINVVFESEPYNFWGVFKAPELPRGLLPKIIEDFAFINAELSGADPGAYALAALTVCGVAFPFSNKIQPKRHEQWKQPGRIWFMNVGRVSAIKSSPLKLAMRPLYRIDDRLDADYRRALAEYEAAPKDEQRELEKPKRQHVVLGAITPEYVQDVLINSPDGVLCMRDELSGLFGTMRQYSAKNASSHARSIYIEAYEGDRMDFGSLTRGGHTIRNFSVSFMGSVQPKMIIAIEELGEEDGMLQRFIPLMSRDAITDTDLPLPPINDTFAELVEKLYNSPREVDGTVFMLDDDAWEIRRQMSERHRLDVQALVDDDNSQLAGHIGKYNGIFARLCLIWHAIEHVGDAWESNINGDTAQRVADFMQKFLLPHAFAFYIGLLGCGNESMLKAIAGYILMHPEKKTITNRDLYIGGVRATRNYSSREFETLFTQLQARGWLERSDPKRAGAPPQWKVNQRVHELYHEHRQEEEEKRARGRDMVIRIQTDLEAQGKLKKGRTLDPNR